MSDHKKCIWLSKRNNKAEKEISSQRCSKLLPHLQVLECFAQQGGPQISEYLGRIITNYDLLYQVREEALEYVDMRNHES